MNRFNEVRSDINEVKQQNIKSDSNFNDMKQCLSDIDEHCSTIMKQMQEDVNDIRKRKESKNDTGKCNENNNNEIIENKVIGSDSENISDNHNEDKLSAKENRNNEGIVDKVSGGVKYNEDYNGAVSYTHLDVYKRQVVRSSKLEVTCIMHL